MAEQTEPSTTMLYRPGDTVNAEAWNRKLDTLVVADSEVADAQSQGWLLAADLDKPAKGAKPDAKTA